VSLDPATPFFFTNTLAGVLRSGKLTEDEGAAIQEMLEFYYKQFKESGASDPKGIAAGVHLSMDGLIEKGKATKTNSAEIKCAKGCAHCCRQFVGVTKPEAALLVHAAKEQGVTINQDLLKRQSKFGEADWMHQPLADTACVFLGPEDTCTVYEHRPNACRKYFVITKPKFCDTRRFAHKKVGRWFVMEAEIVASADMTAFGVDSMPKALLKVLNSL